MSRLDFPDSGPRARRAAAGLRAAALLAAAAVASIGVACVSSAADGDGPAPATATASPKEGPPVSATPGKDAASGATPTAAPGRALVDGEIETLERGSLLPGGDEPLRLVVRDEAAWKALWERIHGAGKEAPPLPKVDFAKDMVLAVSTGKQPTGGFGVVVRGSNRKSEKGETVEEGGARLAVVLDVRRPKPGAIVTQQVTHAFHVVRHVRFDGDVVFEEREAGRPRPR